MLARSDRRHEVGGNDQRTNFQRDRDRILHSSAFRRLAGITQIVRAGEADVFHTRQQHTLKVAQVGRRLAELLIEKQSALAQHVGLDPEVVEAASLAHDLGHPPFGHIGEKTLNRLLTKAGDDDGFEGNAQTFRVITKHAVRFERVAGLDLCRATLAGCLKYPWFRDVNDEKRSGKWGAYRTEADDFEFARAGFAHKRKTAEADIMDWADDIAYSVHDLEDFHRCGAIPWNRILNGDRAEPLITQTEASWFDAPADAGGRLRRAMGRFKVFFEPRLYGALLNETYEGTRDQRQQLRTMTSRLIDRYIKAATLINPDTNDGVCVAINDNELDEVKLLKQITRDYVISNPTLLAQQEGQSRVIERLFGWIVEGTKDSAPKWLPRRLEYMWTEDSTAPRFAVDCVASLTEREVIGLHARLDGSASGSVLDPIVR